MLQMYDPTREYKYHKKEIDESIQNVLNHGLFINGPEVKELESKLSEYVGVKHCIGVSNGTDALKISLLSLGVSNNDEVITVSYSWISTASVISIIDAKPVFVDIEDITYNMDSSLLEDKITEKTKAIIVVSLYGQVADIDSINKIANKYDIPVIEDGAQSFGATYNGKKSCSLTTIGTTSFFPSKPLGCYGDGGACFTNDDELAMKIRSIQSHGSVKRFHHKYIGLNGRLDTIQAAILLTKIKYFDNTLENRNNCANYYSEHLKFLKKNGFILPKVEKGRTSAWAQYSISCNNKQERDNIVNHLKNNNINVAIFYPSPLHTQECFQYLFNGDVPNLPVTNRLCDTIFNLPCYAEITKEEQTNIINVLKSYFN